MSIKPVPRSLMTLETLLGFAPAMIIVPFVVVLIPLAPVQMLVLLLGIISLMRVYSWRLNDCNRQIRRVYHIVILSISLVYSLFYVVSGAFSQMYLATGGVQRWDSAQVFWALMLTGPSFVAGWYVLVLLQKNRTA